MIESVFRNTHDEDTKTFVPDEVFETMVDAKNAVEFS